MEKENSTLECRNVSIEFPGVKALTNVNFSIGSGTIHAMLGANGAGKSTLMKVFAGANPGYTGEVLVNGEVVELRDTNTAKRLGIQIVYQEVDTALIGSMSVAENVMINSLVMDMGKRQFVNWPNIRKRAKETLERLNVHLNVNELCSNLSLAEKQMVLIARAIVHECKFLILDEPTAPLSDTETKELFKMVRHLRETYNMTVIFITHRLYEVLEVCDAYTVMRNGEIVGGAPITEQTTTKEIVEMMLGHSFDESFQKEATEIGEEDFEVSHLCDTEGMVNDVSIHCRKGEIIGIAGLVGAGKTELCKTIFGAMKAGSGEVKLHGKTLKIKNPSDAVKERIALVPEERRKEGVLITETVEFNLAAGSLGQFCNASFVNRAKTAANAKKYVEELGIKTPTIKQVVANLSGGNQQKVAVGKWIAADSDVYIFDEPTKGVDVNAKTEIFRLINDIAKLGKCVIYASSENQELLSISDRIYVMYDGKIMAELETAKTSEDEIMHYSVGATEAYAG